MNHYINVFKKFLEFNGRSSRAEYWYFVLFNFIVAIALGVIDSMITGGMIAGLYSLVVFIPGLAVAVRRLHDTDRSAWWILISLVPLVGFVVLIIFFVQGGSEGDNKYGPNPLVS
jgi:uncharacterized membrane protein YhaH (DUF805 family)